MHVLHIFIGMVVNTTTTEKIRKIRKNLWSTIHVIYWTTGVCWRNNYTGRQTDNSQYFRYFDFPLGYTSTQYHYTF